MGQRTYLKGWDILKVYPPCIVRVLAKRKSRDRRDAEAMTDEEIAISGDIPLEVVEWLSGLDSWDSVKIGLAKRFCAACNFDPMSGEDRNRAGAYVRKIGRYRYLEKSPVWKTQIEPRLRNLKAKGNRK
jgi:hypothetical protein